MDAQALRELAASRLDEYVGDLERMVNVDCGSYTPDGVNEIADLCEGRMRARGWSIERRAHVPASDEAPLGDLVIGTLEGGGGTEVLMVGHMDTVFDEGTVADRPFRIEGDIARGPGVSDMKGGLLAGFHAVEVLQDAGFDAFGRITYVCNPDEEIGSPYSGPVIAELAPGYDAALVLEGARANGDIVSSRKGITDHTVVFTGRAAHAGVEPEKGANAVLAAAKATVALQGLNGRWPGVTVNVGVAQGGTRTNVVPERCELHVDLRSPELRSLEEAETEIARLCAEHGVDDVTVALEVNSWHRPMEKREGGARLAALAIEIATELGFDLHDASTGGASDANTTSAVGTPTIDGLGPIGGDDHAPAEWLDLTSIVPRVALLAGLIARV